MTQPGPEISVIVPTRNERDNVPEVVARISEVLKNEDWEVIFVDDDSPDGTADLVREIGSKDRRVRCVQRIGRRGLSAACIEGILTSSAPLVAVMDGDLQHDTALLPSMFAEIRSGTTDLVVGSRYMEGGAVEGWSEHRVILSQIATRLSSVVLRRNLHDPMSGFFAVRRDALSPCIRRLNGQGFKILLDVLTSAPQLRVTEQPYHFGVRRAGESKLDYMVLWEYAILLSGKIAGHRLPARFILFACIGAVGVLVHLAVLGTALSWGMRFSSSQIVATLIAMSSNFWLNNQFTYRDVRLRGWVFVRGLLSFYLVCSVGAAANVGVAQFIYGVHYGWLIAGLAGAALGAVWNYAASSIFTWGNKGRD